jgi:hypothetical protein
MSCSADYSLVTCRQCHFFLSTVMYGNAKLKELFKMVTFLCFLWITEKEPFRIWSQNLECYEFMKSRDSWVCPPMPGPLVSQCSASYRWKCETINMELDFQSLFGLLYTTVLIGRDPASRNPPPPRIWAHIRGRYVGLLCWSLCNPLSTSYWELKTYFNT